MAAPLYLECDVDVARQWPRLLTAAGLSVRVDADGLSGVVDRAGRSVRIAFRECKYLSEGDGEGDADLRDRVAERRLSCPLSSIRDMHVADILTKTLLATGATCSYGPIGDVESVALVTFGRPCGLADWNVAVSGIASFDAEGVISRSGTPDLPFGNVGGSPVPIRFSTGPQCAAPDRSIHAYLELFVDKYRDRSDPRAEMFVRDVVVKLAGCGGRPVELWHKLSSAALGVALPVICAKCGYDLRATPERCPECGTNVI